MDLEQRAIKLLKEDDTKSLEDTLSKERKNGKNVFSDVVVKLRAFCEERPKEAELKLHVQSLDSEQRRILRNVCQSHYHLTCIEEKDDGNVDVILVERVVPCEGSSKTCASTEAEVVALFQSTVGLKSIWANSMSLNSMWDFAAFTAGNESIELYSSIFPRGTSNYWHEVGWLASSVVA